MEDAHPGRSGSSHVILGPWPRGGRRKHGPGSPGSVAAVRSGGARLLQPLLAPSQLSTPTVASTALLTPGLPSTRKVNLEGSLPPWPGPAAKSWNSKEFQAVHHPFPLPAYLAQEVDIVEG